MTSSRYMRLRIVQVSLSLSFRRSLFGQPWAVPAPVAGHEPVGLFRSPGPRLVPDHIGWVVEQRRSDPPALFDHVLPGEVGAVTYERGLEQPLVGGGTLAPLLGELQVELDRGRAGHIGAMRIEDHPDPRGGIDLENDLARLGAPAPRQRDEMHARRVPEGQAELGLR